MTSKRHGVRRHLSPSRSPVAPVAHSTINPRRRQRPARGILAHPHGCARLLQVLFEARAIAHLARLRHRSKDPPARRRHDNRFGAFPERARLVERVRTAIDETEHVAKMRAGSVPVKSTMSVSSLPIAPICCSFADVRKVTSFMDVRLSLP
jgi:hypothetical protein